MVSKNYGRDDHTGAVTWNSVQRRSVAVNAVGDSVGDGGVGVGVGVGGSRSDSSVRRNTYAKIKQRTLAVVHWSSVEREEKLLSRLMRPLQTLPEISIACPLAHIALHCTDFIGGLRLDSDTSDNRYQQRLGQHVTVAPSRVDVHSQAD